MPTYEYECEKCGNHFEAVQKMSDAPLKSCPKCGNVVHKVIAGFGVSFKGNGFYVNDSTKSSEASSKSSCTGKSCSGCSGCKS